MTLTGYQRLRQVVIAFLVAVLLACVFAIVGQASDGVVVMPPSDGCALLEPYGWWYFFWGCHL